MPLLKYYLLISTISSLKADVLYDLKDLQALEQEKNFEEFLSHVNDIRPSERQKLWKSMYQSMALEMIDYKIKTKDFSLVTFKKIENIGKSSALMSDEFFQLKRALYAKKFFNECYLQASQKNQKNSDKTFDFKTCDKELTSFWFFSKKDPDIGLELATLIEKYPSEANSWPFYQTAINDSIANLYCQKANVQRAVLAKLTNESFEADFNGQYANLIKRFVPEKCFVKLVPTLKVSLSSPESNAIEKEMALKLLSATNNLTPEEEDIFAIIYLLDGPVVGEKMNLAWKRVEILNAKFTKRQEILDKIKKLPTIPDRIFKEPTQPRNKAIINLFAQNFPELLNFYAESCLAYTNFKTPEAQLASGIACNQFIKAAVDLRNKNEAQWLTDKITTQYSSLKK